MKPNVGLVLLFAVVAISVGAYVFTHRGGGTSTETPRTNEPLVTVRGPVGSEKFDLLGDPEVVKLLRERYALAVEPEKTGSMEIAEDPAKTSGKDFAWPSSQVVFELYKANKLPSTGSEVIFNSPIVLYSWDKITDALIRMKIVQKVDQSFYIVDFPKLITMVREGKKWSDLGLTELYGPITIHTTDPLRSNSGLMFTGLLANQLNGGQVVSDGTVANVEKPVKAFFDELGMMEQSSANLFSQFVTQGMGSNPIIVGYENQLVEFVLQHPEQADTIKKQIRILYPRPTVWSNHPLIVLTKGGARLMKALEDPDIQKIAWERHGFRSGLAGVRNDPKVLQIAGIPEKVEHVVPMPKPSVMKKLLEVLGEGA